MPAKVRPATAAYQAPDWSELPCGVLVHVLAQCSSPYYSNAARRVCKAWLGSINAAIKTVALRLSQLGAVTKFPVLQHLMLEGSWGTIPESPEWQQRLAAFSSNSRLQSLELSKCDELLAALEQHAQACSPPLLPSLRSLIVRKSSFTQAPAWVTQLSGLTQLEMEHSGALHAPPVKQQLQWSDAVMQLTGLQSLRMSGPVSARLPTGIPVLQGLTQLHVIGSLHEVPQEISTLTRLQDLNLSYTQATHVPDALAALTRLTRLCLRGCSGVVPPPPQQALPAAPAPVLPHLTALKQLQHLDLGNLRSHDLAAVPESVTALTALTALDLSGAALFGSITRLLDCTALQELRLCNSRGVDIPHGITALKRLQLLDCGGSQTPLSEALLRLPALEEVTADEQCVSQNLWERLHCKGVTTTLLAAPMVRVVDEEGEELQEEAAIYDDDAEPWADEGF